MQSPITVEDRESCFIRDADQIAFVIPDRWRLGGKVYRDERMPELFDVRIETSLPVIQSLAVSVKQTGRVVDRDGFYRCKITFHGDCEPDEFSGGRVKWFDDIPPHVGRGA